MTQHNQVVVSIGLVRAAFTSEYPPLLFSGDETHEPALKLAAQLVQYSTDDELIRSIIQAALPDQYSGNTLKELHGMIVGARRKGFDTIPIREAKRKLKPAEILSGLFEECGATLFHDPLRKGYIGLPSPSGGVINVQIDSEISGHFLRGLFFRNTGKAIPPRDLDLFQELLKARALFESPMCRVFVRVGGGSSLVCHDLGRDDGMMVEITADGYKATLEPKTKMIRTHGMRSLPEPKPGDGPYSGFAKFKQLMALDDHTWPLVLAFLLSALKPDGPYPCLAVEGEQGSGKSTRCEMCKRVIDPSIPMRSSLPDNAQDMMIIASHRHVVIFDNLSSVKNEMSDALAALATKSGFEKRQLYTDGDLYTIEIARPFALNGIGEFIHRPDLMDRAIPLRLNAMPAAGRRTEDEIWRALEELLPELLHDLYTAVSCAIRNLATTTAPFAFRMADAARWLNAAEPETGLQPGTILSAIEEAQGSTQVDLAMSDSLFPELERVLLKGDFEGRASALLELLQGSENRKFDRYFPATPAQLSTKLRRLRPSLERAGISVEFPTRTREGRHIKISLTQEAKTRAENARKKSVDHDSGEPF